MSRIRRRGAAVVVAACTTALLAGVTPAGATVTGPAAGPAPAVSPSPRGPGGTQHALTADDVRALPQPSVAPGASRATIARAFAVQNARALGLTGDLGPARTAASVGGGSVVRFDQTVGGVPVMGGEVVVDVAASGTVRGAISETLPGTAPATTPSITADTAAATARGITARSLGGDDAGLVVAAPALTVFDPQVLGVPGIPGARLAWRTEVTSSLRPDVRQLVVVDAARGAVLLSVDQIAHGLSRTVCDGLNNPAGVGVPCTTPVRTEGGAASAVADVEAAYNLAGNTYNYFKNTFGRDSVDGAGMPLISTVRYCDPGSPCPFENAFWNGEQMVYGAGFASADDVVAHELTHGVTENTSGLFYFYESGAINESISDIFGEFVDMTDGVGTDTPTTRWQLGEDLPVSFGVIRDMENPPAFNQPDTTDSPFFLTGVERFGVDNDSGAVHTNSGVGNKFAYLLTDGQTFNGVTVTGLGIPKAEQIIYAATQRLTSASDYVAFASALKLACASVVGTAGITSGDCTQVDNAIAATEMDVPPSTGFAAPPAACINHPGMVPAAPAAFSDNFENNASGRWTRAGFYYADQTNPFSGQGWVPKYATSGTNNVWGNDNDPSTRKTLTQATPVKIPANGYLRFNHAFAFDQDSNVGQYYDGGVVEYSTTGAAGPWTLLPATNSVNGYNRTLLGSGTNPLKGSPAFGGVSRGYRTSLFDLASLAGKTVQFRFSLGTDSSIGSYGWFIDDVQVGGCQTPDTTKPTLKAGTLATVSVTSPIVTATATDNRGISGYLVRKRYATSRTAFTAWSAATFRTGTTMRLVEPFVAGRTTCFSIQARDTSGNVSAAQTRCTTTPVDDRSLTRSASAWTLSSSSSAYAGTISTSKKVGGTLVLSGVSGTSLVLVVRKGKGAGTVSVWVGTKRKAVLNLSATSTVSKVKLPITTGTFANAKITIKIESAGTAGVAIDGLAVRRA